MSLFFVDSSCDLDVQQIKSLGIECLNISYEINEQDKAFGEDFDFDKFYSKLRKGVVVTSKGLTVDDYVGMLTPALDGGDDIVYVYSSGEVFDNKALLSAQDALKRAYSDRRIEFIDSKNVSIGCGAVCFELAKMYHNGATIDEIVDRSYEIIDSVANYMIVDSLEMLTLTGAIDSSVAVGSTLNVKFIVTIDLDGKFRLIEKVAGRKRAIAKLIQIIRQTGKNVADNPVFISDSGVKEEVSGLVLKLKEYFGQEIIVYQQRISPSNAVVLGNNAISLVFKTNKKIH